MVSYLLNFVLANWDESFRFTSILIFQGKKLTPIFWCTCGHRSEKLSLFFILNLWDGCEKGLLFYFAVQFHGAPQRKTIESL